MMKDVYTQVESVIAWLDPARESDAAAISLLRQIVTAIELLKMLIGRSLNTSTSSLLVYLLLSKNAGQLCVT
jgi:hypothetical protein